MTTFGEIFKQQTEYNSLIRSEDQRTTDEWTETYLLGIVSEIDDLLDRLQWKRHRKTENTNADIVNLGYDLADLTKFVLSLWEVWGFNHVDVLDYVQQKSQILDELYKQEWAIIPTDKLIIISDIDGTLGDWRASFINWASHKYKVDPIPDNSTSLQLDSDLAMHYSDYFRMKEEFESSGQYRYILTYEDSARFLHWMKTHFDAYLIAHTARPWRKYYRIWGDTWQWIVENDLPIDQLRVGSESRILLANDLGGENVIMLEDDPGLMLRAALSGITVIARKHGYNSGVRHELIHKVDSLTEAKGIVEKCYREKVNLTK